MIKVLTIVNAHFGYDGISTVAKGYYRFQNRQKVRMDFLVINKGDAVFEKEVVLNGDRFFCIECRNDNPVRYLLLLILKIRKGNYDIIHVHGNSATMAIELLAAKLGGVKCRIAHSHNTKCDHIKIHKILFPLFKQLYTVGFACSKEAGEFLFPQKNFYVIKNGINASSYRFNSQVRNSIRKKYDLENKFVIGNIGRMTYQKNQEFLIEILAKLKGESIKLLLVGDGENREELGKLAKRLGVENDVVFLGNVDNVNQILQAMDVFAFPSRFEGLGIVAIEAQACNIPCIISDLVPHEVKVKPDTQFISLTDVKKWLSALLWIKDNIEVKEREESADQSVKEIVQAGYDIKDICMHVLEIYEMLCKQMGKVV